MTQTDNPATHFRILVTGSRDWLDFHEVDDAISDFLIKHKQNNIYTVVHGACASGADLFASQIIARLRKDNWLIFEEAHPADWSNGPSAGPMRNQEMVDKGADICFAFIGPCSSGRCKKVGQHPSHGASGTAGMAERAGIKTVRFHARA